MIRVQIAVEKLPKFNEISDLYVDESWSERGASIASNQNGDDDSVKLHAGERLCAMCA